MARIPATALVTNAFSAETSRHFESGIDLSKAQINPSKPLRPQEQIRLAAEMQAAQRSFESALFCSPVILRSIVLALREIESRVATKQPKGNLIPATELPLRLATSQANFPEYLSKVLVNQLTKDRSSDGIRRLSESFSGILGPLQTALARIDRVSQELSSSATVGQLNRAYSQILESGVKPLVGTEIGAKIAEIIFAEVKAVERFISEQSKKQAFHNSFGYLLESPESLSRLVRSAESSRALARENRDLLVLTNRGLVGRVATKALKRDPGITLRTGYEHEDLVEIGIMGLMRGIEKFDVTIGVKLSTYVTWWIRQAIHREIDSAGFIRVPCYHQHSKHKVKGPHVELANRARSVATFSKLCSRGAKQDLDLPDKRQTAVDPVETEALKEALEGLLGALEPRQRQVVEMRYGLNGQKKGTLEEVGKALNVSKERARQIELKSLEKLKNSAPLFNLKSFLD